MKKPILVFIFLLLASLPAFCQHFYLQPTAGTGLTSAKITAEASFAVEPYVARLGYVGGVRMGIDLQGLRIGTGAEFMHISTKYVSTGGTTFYSTYNHLLIPIYAGYTLPLWNKFSIVPGAGAALSINFFDESLPFKKTSIWGHAQADIEYAIRNHLSITAGPRFYYMLNSIVLHDIGSIGNVQQRNYSMMLSAGLLLQL